MRHHVLCLTLALAAPSSLLAQETPKSTPLERADRTFSAADLSGDGKLDLGEMSRASMSRTVLQSWDEDGNRSLSRDEFLSYYRQLMVNAGQAPGDDLDREIRRIDAARKARKEREEARKKAQELERPP